MKLKNLLLFIIIGSAIFFFNFAIAQDQTSITGDADKKLKIFLDDMIDLVKQNHGTESAAIVLYDRAIKEFDFSTFSMLSLGKKYQEFSKDEKLEFEKYFSKLIARTYVSRLEGQNMDQVVVEYLKSIILKARKNLIRVDVPTNLIHDNIVTPVTYRMLKKGNQDWKIYDVVIEGVTMTANYREQFRNYISESPEKIISDIKKKLEE